MASALASRRSWRGSTERRRRSGAGREQPASRRSCRTSTVGIQSGAARTVDLLSFAARRERRRRRQQVALRWVGGASKWSTMRPVTAGPKATPHPLLHIIRQRRCSRYLRATKTGMLFLSVRLAFSKSLLVLPESARPWWNRTAPTVSSFSLQLPRRSVRANARGRLDNGRRTPRAQRCRRW